MLIDITVIVIFIVLVIIVSFYNSLTERFGRKLASTAE